MANRAKHAFGNLADVEKALQAGKIDNYDILFLDGDTEPKVGWVDKNGIFRLVKANADLSEVEAELAKIESAMDAKADAEEVDAKIAAAMDEHLTKRYEIADVPAGTLVNYGEKEIRICCPANAEFVKQTVGANGDPNCYYATFKTYAPNDNVVGYKEYLGTQADEEILTDLSTDEHGRKFQLTWLALAKYDEADGTWTYYGKGSTVEKYIGWNYKIEWYDANNTMIASDSVRINLSNEDCHFEINPYYIGGMMKEIETIVDEKIAEVESAYEVIEF